MTAPVRCKARNRRGEQCKRAAIPGATVCRYHGGNAPQVLAAARKRVELAAAQDAVVTFGLPREIDPHDALLEELHRTAGHVAWLESVVQSLQHDDPATSQLLDRDYTSKAGHTIEWHKPSVWLEIYERERAHMVTVAATCIKAGIEERRVRLAEQQGTAIVSAFRAALSDLGIDVTPDVGRVIANRLRELATPTTAREAQP